jgi:hypothetical protein
LSGVVISLWPAHPAAAEARYHLVLLPDGARQVTNTGIILSDGALLEPARDAQGDPVWDSDGDGVADGYISGSLTTGSYGEARATRVHEELELAVGWAGTYPAQPVLWTNIWTANGDGSVGTLVDLGRSHGAQGGVAMDINSRGQVVVREEGRDDPWDIWALGLVLVNPKDTDADGTPDLWFEDLDGDGNNDLMIDLEGTIRGGCGNCPLKVNELGQIAGKSNFMGGFVILPEDTDGDGDADMWFRDADGDGVNDLQISLGDDVNDISDGGRIVGRTGNGLTNKDYLMQWQIVPPDRVDTVVQEWAKKGGAFHAVNENLQAVGTLSTFASAGFLWENGQILELVELLDNPEGAEILLPLGINDSGTIVGRCDEAGFVAVPIAPSPPPVCGDGACDPGEDACNCPEDCGTPPTSEADCLDGIDDDCDGLVDCDDTDDCGGDPSCACSAKGDSCSVDSDCCSNACKPNGTCR